MSDKMKKRRAWLKCFCGIVNDREDSNRLFYAIIKSLRE